MFYILIYYINILYTYFYSPTLIARSTDKDAVSSTLIADMSQQNRLIECIITYEEWFFES